jgi:hypothetical protein
MFMHFLYCIFFRDFRIKEEEKHMIDKWDLILCWTKSFVEFLFKWDYFLLNELWVTYISIYHIFLAGRSTFSGFLTLCFMFPDGAFFDSLYFWCRDSWIYKLLELELLFYFLLSFPCSYQWLFSLCTTCPFLWIYACIPFLRNNIWK